jgi:hypothetical protein
VFVQVAPRTLPVAVHAARGVSPPVRALMAAVQRRWRALVMAVVIMSVVWE